MTAFDYAVIAVFLLSIVIGVWRGIVGELISLVAWGAGFFVAKQWGEGFGNLLLTAISDETIRLVAGWALLFVLVLLLMSLLRLAIRSVLQALGLGLSDRILGVMFGACRAILILVALVAVGGMTSLPKQTWWREAYFSPPLETVVLAGGPWLPSEVSKRIRFR